jgi:exodeoxyribonuclease-3
MKLISWNVNGIRACVRNGFGDFLKKTKPDILAIQEIKIDHESRLKEEFDFKGYEETWNPAKRPGYSGTAILSKMKPLSLEEGIGISEFDDEGRVQTFEMPKFYFINTYFPNSQPTLARLDYKSRFNKALLAYIKKLEKKKPVIICGDFNVAREEIDLARPKENHETAGFTDEERKWGRKFIEAGLVDTYRLLNGDKVQYTWWTYRFGARSRNVGWRIDYFLVSAKISKHVKKAFILDSIMGSDHCPVGIEISDW